jgi:hypothetical protein
MVVGTRYALPDLRASLRVQGHWKRRYIDYGCFFFLADAVARFRFTLNFAILRIKPE